MHLMRSCSTWTWSLGLAKQLQTRKQHRHIFFLIISVSKSNLLPPFPFAHPFFLFQCRHHRNSVSLSHSFFTSSHVKSLGNALTCGSFLKRAIVKEIWRRYRRNCLQEAQFLHKCPWGVAGNRPWKQLISDWNHSDHDLDKWEPDYIFYPLCISYWFESACMSWKKASVCVWLLPAAEGQTSSARFPLKTL